MRPEPFDDGSAGDAGYGVAGNARHILAALGDARTVLNVGAGPGSCEPRDRELVAVEPSATTRAEPAGATDRSRRRGGAPALP